MKDRGEQLFLLYILFFNNINGPTGDCPDDQLTEKEKP